MTHKLFFNENYAACGYEFETTRKCLDIAASLAGNHNVELVDPDEFFELTEELISKVHSADYIKAVQTGTPEHLATSQGFDWDSKIYTMAVAHNSGVVAAVDEVLTGSSTAAGTISSGLHHADREGGLGFCTFNGLSAASEYALSKGAERVLILDFDAHCGGGTRRTTNPHNVVQVDVSTSMFDIWDVANDCDLLIESNPEGYIDSIFYALDHADSLGSFDLILYNAGMDPANSGVPLEALLLRERLVFNWSQKINTPLVYTMAGGYLAPNIDDHKLVHLHRLTIDTFADAC